MSHNNHTLQSIAHHNQKGQTNDRSPHPRRSHRRHALYGLHGVHRVAMRAYIDINSIVMTPRRDAMTVILRAIVLWAIFTDAQTTARGITQ